MKLLSLSLKGFRQHKDTEINFLPGLSGIIGSNGAGKSTLIEAIAFAFYGSRAIRGKLEHVRTIGTSPRQEVRANLVFEHENLVYRIERTLSDALLFQAGEPDPLAQGNTEVTTRITSIFAMNYEEFSATFFTEQKGLEFLSGKKGAAERERFIVRMMGYDKLRDIQELLREDRKAKRSAIQAWETNLGERETILSAIRQEEDKIKEHKKLLEDATKALSHCEKEAEKSREKFHALEAKHKAFGPIARQIHSHEVRIQDKSSWLKKAGLKLKEFDSAIQELKNIAASLKFELAALDQAGAISQAIKARQCSTQEGLSALRRKYEEQKNAHLEERISNDNSLSVARSDIQALQAKLAETRELGSKSECPTCGQPVSNALPAQIKKLQTDLSALTELRSKLEARQAELSSDPPALRDLQLEIQKLEASVKALQIHEADMTRLTFQLSKKTELETEIKIATEEQEALTQALGTLKEQADNLAFSEEEFQNSKALMETNQRLLEVARLQRLKIEGEFSKQNALLERSRKELSVNEMKMIELANLKRELALLEQSDQTLTNLRRHLNAQLRPRLAQIASEYLAELSDGRYTSVSISPDFSPVVTEDGVEKSVISGGEEDLLNLCLRLALSSMLAERSGQTFSTLILDEVFGSLDDNRRSNVLSLLEKLSRRFEQILIITHLEDIKEAVHNLISVNYNEANGEMILRDDLEEESQMLAVNI